MSNGGLEHKNKKVNKTNKSVAFDDEWECVVYSDPEEK